MDLKKYVVPAILILMLSGCFGGEDLTERAMTLRSKLLQAQELHFDADITADYGDKAYTFSMRCHGDGDGNIHFEVRSPESISGIMGYISEGEGKLVFDETALHIGLLTDDQVNPVSAPWIMLRTLRSGYLVAAGMEGESLRLSIDDGYEDNALRLDIWLDTEDRPQRVEIACDGRNILSLHVSNFRIL